MAVLDAISPGHNDPDAVDCGVLQRGLRTRYLYFDAGLVANVRIEEG